jgi:photosynthetic reaction center cytochrome c subunit
MNLVWKRMLLGGAKTAVVCLLCGAVLGGQATPGGSAPAAPAEKPQMAEDVLKNIQVLRGISLDEFMGTMGFFASALSLNCIDCHVAEAADDWSKYADDTPLKQTARKMVLMVRAINQANFGGRAAVTCYTCHRSNDTPKIVPSIAEQYEVVPDVDPNDLKSGGRARTPGGPSVDQILDKYIQAVGGAQRLGTLTSFIAKGTYEGFDTADSKIPVDIYAKAPAQRTTIAHAVGEGGAEKDSTTTFDGRNGWVAARNTLVPVLTLSGGNLDGAKVDAEMSFPGQIKQILTNWSSDFPESKIDDHAVQVVQGTMGNSLVKLYFDKGSGLLVRQLRYANTVVGPNPTQVDYSDYRDVSGIKMPFGLVISWTDGRTIIELQNVQLNAPIDAGKFAKPAP